jgi:hypothetical protein
MRCYSQGVEGKSCQPRNLTQKGYPSEMKERYKYFARKTKAEGVCHTKLVLQEILKELINSKKETNWFKKLLHKRNAL